MFWSRAKNNQFPRNYYLCLLTAGDHKRPVKHLQSEKFYAHLLAGNEDEYIPKTRGGEFDFDGKKIKKLKTKSVRKMKEILILKKQRRVFQFFSEK